MFSATASFYKEYELIHKCSKHLNKLIGFPILIMLLSSGMCTVLIMKTVVQYFNSNALEHYNVMVVGIARCLKYIFLIVALCFFSTITVNQVEDLQVILQETLNTQELSKMERRNIKAFLQLTKDNQIVYLLGGVVKMNMALPLNYCSICTTYLLIVIQFSKFLD
ncbi:uncharacterized protein LOC121725349 [Aricia agestis]|uniref:uncharacterized protein LOC121725349 n=1 Tax=Aricia agestis TaxID=91739 RepID=UPI001C20360B|nr:uncharacterized protein LOC121725349 [Aricia agestis]